MMDVDPEKAHTMLKYLSLASSKFREKVIAKGRLHEQLQQVKKLSKSKDFKEQVKELQRRIDSALDAEKKILVHQETEGLINRRLLDRIRRLENKLTHYLDSGTKRAARIRELEDKMRIGAKEKTKEVKAIEEQIRLVERIYERIRREGTYSEADLLRVEQKISKLKAQLQEL